MDKNDRLGKGLSALFTEKNIDVDSLDNKKESDNKVFEIEIGKITVNPLQPREEFDDSKLAELSASIKARGIIQPVTVKTSENKNSFELISGERRLRAAKLAGLEKIPAFIYDKPTDNVKSEMLELALIENIQREDLNPMELSNSFQKLIDDIGLTQEEVAKKVAKSRSSVANYLRLQKLPVEIKLSLKKNEISEAHARTLLRVEDTGRQLELWKKVITHKLSVRKLEDLTQSSAKTHKKKKSGKLNEVWNPYTEKIEDGLRKFFGTRVKLKPKAKSSGEVVIEYYSNDDLERIIEKCEIK